MGWGLKKHWCYYFSGQIGHPYFNDQVKQWGTMGLHAVNAWNQSWQVSKQSVCHLLNKDMQAQVGTFSVLHSRTKAGRSTRSKISWLLSSALARIAEYMSKCHATKAVPDVGKMFQHYLWLGVVLHLPSSAPFPPLQLSHLHFSLVLWLALSFLSPSTLSFFFPLNHSFRFSRKYFFFFFSISSFLLVIYILSLVVLSSSPVIPS